MEKYIKEKSEEMINKLRKDFDQRGINFTKENEMFFRIGMPYGIRLSSLALTNIPFDITAMRSEEDGVTI